MKIVIKGKAGQGIQLLGFVLSNILKDNNYHVSLVREYSPLVRAGESDVFIVFSKEKIENPLVEEADLKYDLRDKKLKSNLLNLYNNVKVLNMILLGMILKKLKIKPKEMKKYLPKKFLKENLEAIKKSSK